MAFASLESSDRIKKLYNLLVQVGRTGVTTLEINEACVSTRASSDVSELRQSGVAVACRYERKTENGRKLFRYYLAGLEPQQETPANG